MKVRKQEEEEKDIEDRDSDRDGGEDEYADAVFIETTLNYWWHNGYNRVYSMILLYDINWLMLKQRSIFLMLHNIHIFQQKKVTKALK